jgi:hypothetical protein
MTSSVLKAVILTVVVAMGIVLLRQAFPDNASQGLAGGSVRQPTTTSSPSPTGTPTSSPSPAETPQVEGVVVQVLNGTTVTGLAAQVSQELTEAGYTVKSPSNSPNTQTTTVLYQPGLEVDAQFLLDTHFPGARLKKATRSVPANVEIQVVLGADYSSS